MYNYSKELIFAIYWGGKASSFKKHDTDSYNIHDTDALWVH